MLLSHVYTCCIRLQQHSHLNQSLACFSSLCEAATTPARSAWWRSKDVLGIHHNFALLPKLLILRPQVLIERNLHVLLLALE